MDATCISIASADIHLDEGLDTSQLVPAQDPIIATSAQFKFASVFGKYPKI